jgi:hypothetical protein
MGVISFLAATAACVMWLPDWQKFEKVCQQHDNILGMKEDEYEVTIESQYLRVQLNQLRLMLYICTAVLILRVVQSSAGTNWILAFIQPRNGPLFDGVRTLLNNYVIVQGMSYTALLAAIYLPAAGVLSARIANLADQVNMGKTSKVRKDWLDDQGLSFDAMTQLSHGLAILAPLLAGPAKDIISHIVSR